MQSHGREIDLAAPGTRVALNLPELTVGSDVVRGDIVTIAGFETTDAIDVVLRRSPRAQRAAALKSGARAYLHHGTARIPAKVILPDKETLEHGQEGVARLQLQSAVLAFVGDRFVIRDGSEQNTLAGGVVLDANARSSPIRNPEHHQFLSACATATDDVDVCVNLALKRRKYSRSSDLLRRSHFGPEQISASLQRLHHQEKIFVAEEFAVEINAWRATRRRAVDLIDRFHSEHPERPGMPSSELRAALSAASPTLVDLVINDLCANDFIRADSALARRSHRPLLAGTLAIAADEIRKTFSQQPYDPPARKQIEINENRRKALRFLIERGEIVEISSEVTISADALAKMKSLIVEFLSKHGTATVGELRQELVSSRRIMVPLLESLDREGLTRRIGDKRILGKRPMTNAADALS